MSKQCMSICYILCSCVIRKECTDLLSTICNTFNRFAYNSDPHIHFMFEYGLFLNLEPWKWNRLHSILEN